MITQQASAAAIILLYPSKTQTAMELRESASNFCAQNNITVIDVISLSDDYDYFAMRRFAQVLAYNTKPMAIVTNRSILTAIPPLTLWSILDTTSSAKSISLMESFVQELKVSSVKVGNFGAEDFRILGYEEVSHMSDWLESMRYAIARDNKACYGGSV